MQDRTNFYNFFFKVCSTPPTRYGLTYIIGIRQILNKWVDGDKVSYRCTGSGLISDTVTNECLDNGQWGLILQSLPSCCKFNKKLYFNLIKLLKICLKQSVVWQQRLVCRESFFVPCLEKYKSSSYQ